MRHLLANLVGKRLAHPPLDPMPTLRHALHLSAPQLLLANLADILEADPKAPGQLAKAHTLALISTQNAAAQIVRNRFRHVRRVAESRAATTIAQTPTDRV